MSLTYEPASEPQVLPLGASGRQVLPDAPPEPQEQPLDRNGQWFRGGLVFEAHRLLYHSAYGLSTFLFAPRRCFLSGLAAGKYYQTLWAVSPKPQNMNPQP